jgi:hypothetical protein
MRTLVFVTAIASLLLPVSQAQPHPGGVLLGGGNYSGSPTSYLNGMFLVGRTGQLTTFVDTTNPPRALKFQHSAMGLDNRTLMVVAPTSNYSLQAGLFRYDPATRTYSTVAGSDDDFAFPYGVTAGQDGEWYVNAQGWVDPWTPKHEIYRVSETGSWTTVLKTTQLGVSQAFTLPTGRDVDSGDLLIPTSWQQAPTYALSEDGTLSTWYSNSTWGGPQPVYGWTQEVATGDLIYMRNSTVYRYSKGTSKPTYASVALPPAEVGQPVIFDNQTAARPLLIAYTFRQSSTLSVANLRFIDPVTAAVTRTVNFIQANAWAAIPFSNRAILHHRDRYIQTVKTGSGRWDLRFSVPAFPAKGYVVGVAFSGVRPGFKLASGRSVWLNFDPLLVLTVRNLIRPYFDPGPMVLDSGGEAKGSIDIHGLPLPLKTTAHVVLAVIDAAAPDGIAFVTEPYPLRL